MIENKTCIIILARYSSARLPGKVLKTINEKPILSYIIERVEQVISRERIIIATSIEPSDDAIAAFSELEGIKCYRGSLDNVSQRFYNAAKTLTCDYACRINGDNIFLDVKVLQKMLEAAETYNYNFLSNVKNRTYPKGMSVEIVDIGYYKKWLPTILAKDHYREHVMVYLYERAKKDKHFYLQNEELPEIAGIQLALDTPSDFERSKWMIEHMEEPHYETGIREIWKLYKHYEQLIER